tara:strand:+ start:195 stop:446 length:252 start_codon:yes stop_codon:yes gene_type:complete
LAFGKTKSQARAAYDQRSTSCRTEVSTEKPDYLNVKHRASRQSGYVMAHIGRHSRIAADQLYAQLRQTGCVCAVYANKYISPL